MYCKFFLDYTTAICKRKKSKSVMDIYMVIIERGNYYKVLDDKGVSLKIDFSDGEIAYVRKDEVEVISDEEYMVESL